MQAPWQCEPNSGSGRHIPVPPSLCFPGDLTHLDLEMSSSLMILAALSIAKKRIHINRKSKKKISSNQQWHLGQEGIFSSGGALPVPWDGRGGAAIGAAIGSWPFRGDGAGGQRLWCCRRWSVYVLTLTYAQDL